MREIPLTQGQVALVDDEDYSIISSHGWHARKSHRTFYAARNAKLENGKRSTVFMHVQMFPGILVDHKDGNGCNNQRCNLRSATFQQNGANARKALGKVSVFKGVTWNKSHQRWAARIGYNYKCYNLGFFTSQEEAAMAYDAAAAEFFGEFAKLNFPIECP